MKRVILNPLVLGLAAVAAAAAAFGRFPIAALALVCAVGVAVIGAMKAAQAGRAEDEFEDLPNEDRARLAPLRKLRREIRAIVEGRKDDVSIAVVGAEADAEAGHILTQCARMVQLRRELRKNLSGSDSEQEIATLEQELSESQSDAERAALQAAISARRTEADHYRKASDALERIDASLRQAEASLSEMKARLATSLADADESPRTELLDTIGRMRALGTSLDEAEEWLKEQA
jgi:hypothetical protein